MVSTIGVVGQQCVSGMLGEVFEWHTTEGESPVTEN